HPRAVRLCFYAPPTTAIYTLSLHDALPICQVIGPAGGWFVVGANVLWVDSLALSAPVQITAVAPSDTIRRVRLHPDGLQFSTGRSEEHTSELQSRFDLVCRLLLEKKNKHYA